LETPGASSSSGCPVVESHPSEFFNETSCRFFDSPIKVCHGCGCGHQVQWSRYRYQHLLLYCAPSCAPSCAASCAPSCAFRCIGPSLARCLALILARSAALRPRLRPPSCAYCAPSCAFPCIAPCLSLSLAPVGVGAVVIGAVRVTSRCRDGLCGLKN